MKKRLDEKPKAESGKSAKSCEMKLEGTCKIDVCKSRDELRYVNEETRVEREVEADRREQRQRRERWMRQFERNAETMDWRSSWSEVMVRIVVRVGQAKSRRERKRAEEREEEEVSESETTPTSRSRQR